VNMGGVIGKGSPNGGAVANPSGIVSFHQFRLDSIWLSQKFAKDKIVVTAGFMASQDFYGLQEYGGSFLNEPMDYNYGNMGNVRASYDPESGPGAEIKVIPNKHFYVKTAVFLPSDDSHVHPYRPTFLNYKSGDHGSTWDSEVGVHTFAGTPSTQKSYQGIIKAGFIYNGSQVPTRAVQAVCSSNVNGCGGFPDYKKLAYVNDNYTFYLQANQPVFRVAPGSNRGLDVTFGFNIGPQNKSEIPTQFTAGLIFNGPIPCRSKDGLAFGMVYSKFGSDWVFDAKNGLLPSGAAPISSVSDEKLFEINYKAMIAPWLVLQPVGQFYQNVGGSGNNATIAGFRLVTTF
jgi:porin